MTQCLNNEPRNGDGPAASLCSIRRFRWRCAQENAPRSGFNLWNALPCAHATSGCGIFSLPSRRFARMPKVNPAPCACPDRRAHFAPER